MRMVASPKQQEKVMDTQKVEALSDDQLDAVAGGFFAKGLANQVTQVVLSVGQGGYSGSGGQKLPRWHRCFNSSCSN